MPKSTVNSGVSNADAAPGELGHIPDGGEAAAVEGLGYDVWTKDELAGELGDRGLAKSGNKPELIERLEADDAAKTEAAEAAPVEEQTGPESV